jgi:alpha-galactosidase
MGTPSVLAHLTDERTSLLFVGDGGMPCLVHWGAALGQVEPELVLATQRPVPSGGLDIDAPLGLVAEASGGWFGRPGLVGHRSGGLDFAPRFVLDATIVEERCARFELSDRHAGLALDLRVELDASGVALFTASLANIGIDDYSVDALRISLPMSAQARELLTVGGRWTNEFGQTRTPWIDNCLTVENRRGKTSHERLGVVFAGTPAFSEHSGEVWGCHLGWSGNFELTCDAVTDARRSIQVGELLTPGEVVLAPGERYLTPTSYAVHSTDGLNSASNAYHRYLRARPGHPTSPRPALLNTWEAVYFDHDLDKLLRLADAAAACGVERFVLDDGWFHARRNDHAGLGDWWVDPDVWPKGLGPIVDHVKAQGMQFGIWVEPEMVNPDSDLYREHPDWALVDRRYPHVYGRHQLLLDLGRRDVRDHLFGRLDALLGAHDIAYVKWDMNRDLVAPTSGGHASVHDQTLGVYELFDRLRAAHPNVEFESCASGGGRVDFGIIERVERVWTSDSIDALDRQRIQRGFSLLFPPELMGSHIGSSVAHTTGRSHRLALRATAALFGSFGIEWNLLETSEAERAEIAGVVAIYKRFRSLLHGGDVVRVDHPDPRVLVHGVVAADRTEALFAAVRLDSGPSLHTPPLRFPRLDPDRRYHVQPLALAHQRWGPAGQQPVWLTEGVSLTGRQLGRIGVHAPVLLPETAVLVHITTSDPTSGSGRTHG